jgi:hypothetical protein
MKFSGGFISSATMACFALFMRPAEGQQAFFYSNASLKGTYQVVTYQADSIAPSVAFNSNFGTLIFDGAGNVSIVISSNDNGVISKLSNSATYSVSADGTFAFFGGANASGAVLENGRVFIANHQIGGQVPNIVVGFRQEGNSDNTSSGADALASNTTGTSNTAAGAFSLYSNTSGNKNTALGYGALYGNTTGYNNGALGYEALLGNTTGFNNTAFGLYALLGNTTGYGNAAQGVTALYSNQTGIRNTAIGNGALYASSTGSYNIAIGWSSGFNLVTGDYNIDIGNLGMATESGTIRIGSSANQTATYIAGIAGAPVTGAAVYVTSTGQLGVLASSERFKTDVAAMESSTSKLDQLRPVTFKLKSDPQGSVQYGLIAEEVAKVYPELVIRNEDGRIDGVRYEELAPMLLNEMQRQQRKLVAHEEKLAAQAQQLGALQQQFAQLQQLNRAMQAALSKLQTVDSRVAMR